MAQDPGKPKDSGKVGLPKPTPGMNKLAPDLKAGGKGSKDDPAILTLGSSDKKKPDKAEDEKLLAKGRKRFERALSAESENRKEALDDLKFKAGDQWPSSIQQRRNKQRRPCLTINKMKTFIHQVTNDLRQNRPAINVSPVGDKSDPKAAKAFRGLIRAIERDSTADIAYDTAADLMVSCGRGFVEVCTEYEAAETFNQVLRIKRVRNQFTVYLDPDAQEPDFADGNWAFKTEMMPREEFEDQFPHADRMPWNQAGIGDTYKNWVEQDAVRVALYYVVEKKPRTLVCLDNGHTGWEDELGDAVKDQIESGAVTVENERWSETRKVMCYKMTAVEVLERYEMVFTTIPLVPMIGDEIDIQGQVKLSGVIRDARDAQRMYNFWRSLETELIALQPKAPWVGAEGFMEGHPEWKVAHDENVVALEYVPKSLNGQPVPPPQRQPFTGAPTGVEAAIQGAAQDMMATTGIRFDATMNERMTDESGRAIRELRRSGDLTTFHYPDNMGRTLRRVGYLLIEGIPRVYDTRRIVTILREDDKEELVQIDPDNTRAYEEKRPAATPAQPNPKMLKILNPTVGRYGIAITIGPSFATKRIEASESMMAFAKALPNVAALIADLIAKNQDWPGAEEIAARLAKAVPPQLMTADQKDIPPQAQAMLQALQNQIKQMMQERMQLIRALTEKVSDRALAKDKIDKDYKAKILKLIADLEKAQMAQQGDHIAHIVESAKELAAGMSEGEEDEAPAEDPIILLQKQNAEMQKQLDDMKAQFGKPKGVKMKKGADGAYEVQFDYSKDRPGPTAKPS